ncbi:MAG: hypothetical protein K8W52_28515 [Deltaproteobacteria bacterium]|nr:hypothetical protein [Deltaproteobacteria bacterium]
MPVRDPEALANACKQLFTDRARIAAMGALGRKRVEALYDARKVADHMLEVMGL